MAEAYSPCASLSAGDTLLHRSAALKKRNQSDLECLLSPGDTPGQQTARISFAQLSNPAAEEEQKAAHRSCLIHELSCRLVRKRLLFVPLRYLRERKKNWPSFHHVPAVKFPHDNPADLCNGISVSNKRNKRLGTKEKLSKRGEKKNLLLEIWLNC